MFVCNQSQFSFLGRQPLTKLSHISRTFWLMETKLRSGWDVLETSSRHLRRLCDYIEIKFVLRIFWTCPKNSQILATQMRSPATRARKLRTMANVSRHFGNTLTNAIRNLSQTVAAQWDTSLRDTCAIWITMILICWVCNMDNDDIDLLSVQYG